MCPECAFNLNGSCLYVSHRCSSLYLCIIYICIQNACVFLWLPLCECVCVSDFCFLLFLSFMNILKNIYLYLCSNSFVEKLLRMRERKNILTQRPRVCNDFFTNLHAAHCVFVYENDIRLCFCVCGREGGTASACLN